MFPCELIHAADPAVVVLTDWMPRGADNAVFTVDLTVIVNCDVTVTVYHKNGEETGTGASAGAIVTGTYTAGLHSATKTSLMEMVRYRFEVVIRDAKYPGGLMYRILPPTWFNTARVPA